MKVNMYLVGMIIMGVACLVLTYQVVTLEDELYQYDAYLYWYELEVDAYVVECEQAVQTNLDTAALWMDRYYACSEGVYG